VAYDPLYFGKQARIASMRRLLPRPEHVLCRSGADLWPRRVQLTNLRGAGLARIGADAELTSGPDYELARRWALALHSCPRKPDGILYRARHDPGRTCAAIFDRAESVITADRTRNYP